MKRHSRAFQAASLALTILLCAANPLHAAKHKIRWLLGHPNLDYFEEAAASFKAAVEQGSHGDIEVQIVPAANPWENTQGRVRPEIADKVAKGEAEMGHSFTNIMGKLDHRLWAFDLPYLFTGYTHLEGVFEGPVGSELLEGLRAKNIVGLAFTYSGGAEGVATTDREIRGPEDLKGRRIGVFGTDVDNAWLAALGAAPVAIEHQLTTIDPLTQDRSIDSVVVTWRRLHEAHLQKRYKYVNLMGSSYLVSVTYVNKEFFDGLPEAYRALVKDAARTAARIERAKSIELNETTKREMLAKGVSPVYLSQASRLKFQEALRPVYERALEGIVGKDLIERLRKTEPAPHPSGIQVVSR
ncbi:MAG: TRAP transporter substrate-binding protein [Elusimicrobia bacterium]|nr:TRAP transporter substrate-binding protein [Elusimicrobiota bacterium]